MLANLKQPTDVLGILLDNLGLSQPAFTTAVQMHKYIANDGSWDVSVFIKDTTQFCVPCNFPIFQLYNAYSYDGCMVATSLDLANKLLTFPHQKKRFYYLWDMEWYHHPMPHKILDNIYNNPKMEIICRSNEQAKYFEDAWGRKPKGVVQDFNISDLIGVING